MGLMVERPGRRWGWRWSQGLSFRSLASQVGCGGPQSQCEVGRAKARLFSPFTVLGPSSAGEAEWGKVAMHRGSPASPSPGQGLRAALGSWLRRSLG